MNFTFTLISSGIAKQTNDSESNVQLNPFKNGAFRLAIEMKAPIIPITSLDTWKVFWNTGSQFGSRPGISHIFVHKPIETAHLTLDDADTLRDNVHNLIKEKLELL